MKRSNAPIFWSLFGAGGILSALIGPALVFITGIAAPSGLLLPRDTMSYPHMLAFAQHWADKGFVFIVISLFLWHGAHRIFHSLHDLGCYGAALFGTIVAAVALGSIALQF